MAFKIDQYSSLEFENIQLLDMGHMSEVHLAQCVDNPDLKVAIKRCRKDSTKIDEWQTQIGHEISTLSHLNLLETPDWSFEMSLRNRLNLTQSTVNERSIIQLISVFEVDGLDAIALEIAPPSITSQQLDKYTLVDVMQQLAQTTHLIHENGVAYTDFNPLIKIPRIRWDQATQRIKIIDWNVTSGAEDYKRRDIIFLGRIYFQLLTGFPAWAKMEPHLDGLPNRINEYALEITGAGVEGWLNLESAIRDVIERLMIEDMTDAITNSEQLLTAMNWVQELADLSRRIKDGSTPALNEMEELLQEASNSRPPQLRRIVDIGSFFLDVVPESHRDVHEHQVEQSLHLLKRAYLDRIAQAIKYIDEQQYGNAVAELDNARGHLTSNRILATATEYRYTIARIGEELQNKKTLDDVQLKSLIDQLVAMVKNLETRLWDIEEAEQIRDTIKQAFPEQVLSIPLIQVLFGDIDASKLYTEQVMSINSNVRQSHIDQGWQQREAQRLTLFQQTIIPNLEKAEQQSLIKGRVTPRLEQLRSTITADQQDYEMVTRFLTELSQGATSIDIETYLAQSTLDRPYAPLTISSALLPKDQNELSADEVARDAIERYQAFRQQWDDIMNGSETVREKLDDLSHLVSENEDMIDIFHEQLPTVTIPGATNERKTVYKDLEDLTQFVKAVNSVYGELGSIGLNRIPNINNIQKKWVYVTNVQDPDLKRLVAAIQGNLATHTHDKVRDKSLPPELAMLVYEMLDVPIPTEVMQIGQEIQLHKYVRDTLRQSTNRLQDVDEIETVIGELNRLTARSLGELDEAIRQLLLKLENFRDALRARTLVRQIRSLYNVLKRKVESENTDILAFRDQIDTAVEDLIDQKVRTMEQALDQAKTSQPLDREQETIIRETQHVIDTLRHNNRLHERRWHHVQNSQAYLLREHSKKLEDATTSFNDYQYAEARRHINRAFHLAQLFDMPHDNRLIEELKTAEEMVLQLQEHFTITRAIENVNVEDIAKLLEDELTFWIALQNIVKDLSLKTLNDDNVELTFDPHSVERLINCLKHTQTVTKSMDNIHRTMERLNELEQMIDIHDLGSILNPLRQRLEDLLRHNYTVELSKQIKEIEEIATKERIISNESIIKRLNNGHRLVELNTQLSILDANDSGRRQRQLQSNTYTVLKNMQLKNRDERQALADFIETMNPNDVQSREFQGVLTRLAEDPASYAYLMEQVHTIELPNFQSGLSRQARRIIIIGVILITVAFIAGLILSGTLPIEGFTLAT